MKKFLFLVLALCLMLTGCAYCEELDEPDNVGFLTRLKSTPEEFFMLMKKSWSVNGWIITGGDHSTSQAKFYDTLNLMQMALSRDDIQEMILPDFVADYLIKINKEYSQCCVSNSGNMALCFGFMKDNDNLRNKWNSALISMKNDNTLEELENKYIKNFPKDTSYDYIYGINKKKRDKENAIRFTRFKRAGTIRVALTGDLPPVDFIAEDGTPAGYSVAVLAEIGRRLRVNIVPVNIDSGARSAALVSGRADVVFWYEVNKSLESQPDVPDEIILSEPYLSWEKFIHVRFNEPEGE
ncbi:MAG: transporter substrate-binding domain-containing protein [Synergistaceae bacterium]|nr:transporter substrate-binding domain-containing protein [Synergistaceae bacterium]